MSEAILTLLPLPKKLPNLAPRQKIRKKLFTVKGRKLKLSTQGQGFAPFFGNVTKVKIYSEIEPPLTI